MATSTSIAPVKKGDTVTIIAFMVPSIRDAGDYSPTILVKPDVTVVSAGPKAFNTANRRYAQADLGQPSDSTFRNSYNIVIPSTIDPAAYIDLAKKKIQSSVDRTVLQLQASLDALQAVQATLPSAIAVKKRDLGDD